MQLAITVLSISAPVFVLAMIGFIWAKSGTDYPLPFVTRMTMGLSTPCLLFVSLANAQVDPAELARLTSASVLSYVVIALILAGLLLAMRMNLRTNLSPLTFGNTGNLGLPLALFAFGQSGLELAVVVFAVMAIMSFTIGVWMVSGGGQWRRMLSEPIVWATIFGGLILWQGWQLPDLVISILRLIGQMAIPLMLITLGVAMAQLRANGILRAAFLSIIKIALCAIVAWNLGGWMGLDQQSQAVLMIQTATPVAVTSYFIALKYNADSDAVAALVVVSTALSVLAMPLLLAFAL